MNGKMPELRELHRVWLAGTFERFERPLVAYARCLLRGDIEAARDVTQEVFVQLCKEPWPEIESKAEAWLFRVCRNKSLDRIKRWENRMHKQIDTESWNAASDQLASDPAVACQEMEILDRVRDTVRQLSDRHQEILGLRLQQGLSYQQIAEVTGLSVSNVGVQLHEAIMKLRVKLKGIR
jgi:RNA polymerase sigma-70 factor, ECF subfamily